LAGTTADSHFIRRHHFHLTKGPPNEFRYELKAEKYEEADIEVNCPEVLLAPPGTAL
jgi:hypothetical protein